MSVAFDVQARQDHGQQDDQNGGSTVKRIKPLILFILILFGFALHLGAAQA